MTLVSSGGSTLTWGTASFMLTSFSVQSGGTGGNEMEITSMSSKVKQDPDNTDKWLVRRDFDAAFDGEGDISLSVDFLLEPWMVTTKTAIAAVGLKKDISLILPADELGQGAGFQVVGKAILTQMSLGASVGEYVSGNATFRVSGD